MARDAQGNELAGATGEAAAHLDSAVRAFALAYGDVAGELEAARRAAPTCPMVLLTQAWLQTLANDPAANGVARTLLVAASGLPMGPHERAHHAAISHAVEGRWAAAASVCDRHLMAAPRDLLAHQAALRLDGFLGRFHMAAPRSARALPLWPGDVPGRGILLSFYGFGLEEAGDYARAEDVSREAAALEPHGYWPHHAVSHVLEMTGRPRDGLRWMAEREPLWAGSGNTNQVHIWWHKALFHVELGEEQAALALYDDRILPTLRPVGTSLCNPTALLWRLESRGIDAGDRWRRLAGLWRDKANGHASIFNDIHYAMTAARAGHDADVEALLAAMRRSAAGDGELAATYAATGVPVAEGMAAFARGDHREALEKLLSARAGLWRMGGSKAQRDVVEWTLARAAVNAGEKDVALALAHERHAARPASAVNQSFLREAEALVA